MIRDTKTNGDRIAFFHETLNDLDLQCSVPGTDIAFWVEPRLQDCVVGGHNFCVSGPCGVIELRIGLIRRKSPDHTKAAAVIYAKAPSRICQSEALITACNECARLVQNRCPQQRRIDRCTKRTVVHIERCNQRA